MRAYNVGTHTWGEPSFFPENWYGDEGSLTRARNGDLIAAFRTLRPGVPYLSDHYMGIFTTRSSDNGVTWSEPAVHFLYGHHHCSLLVLGDGRILMTYVARIGELDGRTYHGIEAVVSQDNGATWDWERRCILFRGSNEAMHSPQSVQLSDGGILTSFMYHTDFTWCEGERVPGVTNVLGIGHVSAAIWSVD